MTSSRVLPTSCDNGTISKPAWRSRSMITGRAATVAARSPPPSCKRITPPPSAWAMTLSTISLADGWSQSRGSMSASTTR